MTTFDAILHTLYVSGPAILLLIVGAIFRIWVDAQSSDYFEEIQAKKKAINKVAEKVHNKVAA